ncbi:MAG: hypothetical protein IPG29_17235 [Sphingobacteriales bacterium]|nr:hypothetical protein [Sphingobacteriales bacterium]
MERFNDEDLISPPFSTCFDFWMYELLPDSIKTKVKTHLAILKKQSIIQLTNKKSQQQENSW